jgi:hypothetical protein
MLDQRGQLLRAALGFAGCAMPSYDRALCPLRTWLGSWPVIGHVAVGMHRQGSDLQLTQYDERGMRPNDSSVPLRATDPQVCTQRFGSGGRHSHGSFPRLRVRHYPVDATPDQISPG